jgi:hypothetical protein
MKKALWCLFLTCAAVFGQSASSGQSTPDNAALEALKKRILGMNLLNPPAQQPIVLAGPVTQSKVCAIPLLRVIPPGTTDKVPVIKPQGRILKGDTVQVPAPACDEALFTNNK